MSHQLSVARKVVEMAKSRGEYSEEELQELFLMGYLHDVGYEFVDDPSEHASAGGDALRRMGFKYWQEVSNHGIPGCSYASSELDLLNSADMHTSPIGNPVSYKRRLDDIRERYGVDSTQYRNAATVIAELKEKGYE